MITFVGKSQPHYGIIWSDFAIVFLTIVCYCLLSSFCIHNLVIPSLLISFFLLDCVYPLPPSNNVLFCSEVYYQRKYDLMGVCVKSIEQIQYLNLAMGRRLIHSSQCVTSLIVTQMTGLLSFIDKKPGYVHTREEKIALLLPILLFSWSLSSTPIRSFESWLLQC